MGAPDQYLFRLDEEAKEVTILVVVQETKESRLDTGNINGGTRLAPGDRGRHCLTAGQRCLCTWTEGRSEREREAGL